MTDDDPRLTPCRFGYEEHDGARYCFAHGGFWEAGTLKGCDARPAPPSGFTVPLPLHRTEANGGRTCSTCDGGGCFDCTDSAQ